MNLVILMGRLTREPEIRYNADMAIASYTLAVDGYKKDTTDFISCKAFGKSAEFVEKYLKKGTKILVTGRIQTGSYERDGYKVKTTDVVVEKHEFPESKNSTATVEKDNSEGFMPIADIPEEELPFM